MTSNYETLPDFLIADLYRNSLVELGGDELMHENAPNYNSSLKEILPSIKDETIKYLGGNKKKVIVVVNDEDAPFINDADFTFLSNILAACKLTLDDISIINNVKQPLVFNDLKEKMAAQYFLLFGVEPTDIKMPFVIPQFQVQQYAACTIVTAPALKQLNVENETGKLLRTKLWLSLQRCFDIKATAKN